MYEAVAIAIGAAVPWSLSVQDEIERDQVHYWAEMQGSVFYHKVYSRTQLISMPDHIPPMEVREAADLAWKGFVNSTDWTTYWEVP